MKNFFMVSAFLYTLGIGLIVFASQQWPGPVLVDPPPTSPEETFVDLASFSIIIAALTSFAYGLWDRYHK